MLQLAVVVAAAAHAAGHAATAASVHVAGHGSRARKTHEQLIYSFSNEHPRRGGGGGGGGSANAGEAAHVLPFCVDNEPAHVTLSEKACATVQGAATWLCSGLLRMQRASCEQLGSVDFLKAIVLQVGLKPDGRAEKLYGNASRSMVVVHGKSAKGKVGLWQSPDQIAAALIHVGSRVDVSRYIEVGVYTAWTCSFVSAYLRRVPRGGENSAHAAAGDETYATSARGVWIACRVWRSASRRR